MRKNHSFDRGLGFTELARNFEAYCREHEIDIATQLQKYRLKYLPQTQRTVASEPVFSPELIVGLNIMAFGL